MGVLHPNGAAFVVAMLAAARIGAVVVPFSTFATGPELQQQLVHSTDTRILLARAFRRPRLRRSAGISAPWLRHLVFDNRIGEVAGEGPVSALGGRRRRLRPLAIIYTSGLTALPKGAVVHPTRHCSDTSATSTRFAA